MATADFTVIPLGVGGGVSEYLAEVHRRLEAQDLVAFRMHGMGTLLDGEAEDIFRLVAEMHAVPFELGVPRVYTILKLDERRDQPARTNADKERSVQEKLGRS
jgi:uncharacterized protein (TIGR00106 family)